MRRKAGIPIVDKTPMIATTINSSTSVKPRSLDRLIRRAISNSSPYRGLEMFVNGSRSEKLRSKNYYTCTLSAHFKETFSQWKNSKVDTFTYFLIGGATYCMLV